MAEPKKTTDASVPPPAVTQKIAPEQMLALLDAADEGAEQDLRTWTPPAPEDLQTVLPQYEITAFVARGGMGAVYKGVQRVLHRTVAIKVLPPEWLIEEESNFGERFKQEARAMATLSHPNIVAVHEAGEAQNGMLYFVMEFVEGADLAQVVAKEGRIGPKRALGITRQVCEALAFAHARGIVHRDIKPSNIMVDGSGLVKVADFGLAKLALPKGTSAITAQHCTLGTPDYMAPEALASQTPVDQRADLYAVGVMLYQMLTGQVPRGRFAMPSVMVPGIDRRLDAIVDKAMQTDRAERYHSALQISRDVENITRTAEPYAVALRGHAGTKRALLGVALAALSAGCFYLFQSAVSRVFHSGVSKGPPLPTVPASIESRVTRLWDAAEKLPADPDCRWDDRWQAVRLDGRAIRSEEVTARDLIFRVSTLMNADAQAVRVLVRMLGKGTGVRSYSLNISATQAQLYCVQDNRARLLKSWNLPRAYAQDEWLRLEMRAIGHEICVVVDGVLLGVERDSVHDIPGCVALYARENGYFRDIALVPLDGLTGNELRALSPDR